MTTPENPDPPTTADNPDHVHPALRRAEAEVARHLEEACDDDPTSIAQQSTDELLRLEEELLAAARAVEQAVRLRRKLGEVKAGGEKQEVSAPPESADSSTRVREFRTASGSEWRVWEVRPGAGGRPRKLELYPADYARGWLAFELLSGDRRKRLPAFGSDWATASDAELERLLEQAVEVPKRKPMLSDEPRAG